MRYETERGEGITAGFSKLVGADKSKIIDSAVAVLSQEKIKSRLDGSKNPYGDGYAADKILTAINDFFQ